MNFFLPFYFSPIWHWIVIKINYVAFKCIYIPKLRISCEIDKLRNIKSFLYDNLKILSLHCALLLWPTLHWLMEDFGHLFSTNRQTTRPPFSYYIVDTACPVNACHKDQFCMNCIHFHNCILAFGVTFARLAVTMEPKNLGNCHIWNTMPLKVR